jgi:hypothetical protein
MYSQSSKHKPKPKIDPMNMDFGYMIKNHPEFFTKLSTRDHVPERPPPASGGFSRLPSLPDGFTGYSNPQPFPGSRGGGRQFRRVGGPGATLKPKIFPPTLMRKMQNLKDFSNNASIFLFFNF